MEKLNNFVKISGINYIINILDYVKNKNPIREM